jgi:peptide-methionine (S)-S-oxide reductase
MTTQPIREQATFGGGCFWCLEAVYVDLKGVDSVVSGYAGGHTPNPTYRQVCEDTTGHAEVVQITYDPKVVSYRDLLNVFFTVHDPTTLNRQGNDVGTSYRSIILHQNPAQEAAAREAIREVVAAGTWSKRPIVTEVKPLDRFWPAEAYHQNYYRNNPDNGYCILTIEPKLAKLRKYYLDKLRK